MLSLAEKDGDAGQWLIMICVDESCHIGESDVKRSSAGYMLTFRRKELAGANSDILAQNRQVVRVQ